jgi:hypothetical protein
VHDHHHEAARPRAARARRVWRREERDERLQRRGAEQAGAVLGAEVRTAGLGVEQRFFLFVEQRAHDGDRVCNGRS